MESLFPPLSPTTKKFCCDKIEAFDYKRHPTLGLNPIMKSINTPFIALKQKETLRKFINGGHFVGLVGHNYLTRIKNVPPTDKTRSIPNFCIYTKLVNRTHQDPSYQLVFWDSPVASGQESVKFLP